MIAAVIAALLFSCVAAAQKDAAEKAKEGGIDHWIEYYKAEQRKPAASPPPQTVTPASSQPPVERSDPGSREEADHK